MDAAAGLLILIGLGCTVLIMLAWLKERDDDGRL